MATKTNEGTAWTAGPWTAGRAQNGRYGVWATPAMYGVLDATAPGINVEANARLIAAAPELARMVDHLVGIIRTLGDEWTLPTYALDASNDARALLARIRGEGV